MVEIFVLPSLSLLLMGNLVIAQINPADFPAERLRNIGNELDDARDLEPRPLSTSKLGLPLFNECFNSFFLILGRKQEFKATSLMTKRRKERHIKTAIY